MYIHDNIPCIAYHTPYSAGISIMYMLPLVAAGVVVISLMISGSGGTMLSNVVNQKDGSRCIELDSHSGEMGCE